MHTLQALLAAARDAPDDDLPRLALGDFLMEQSDPLDQARGEFIHLQCRLARLAAGEPEREGLQERERELLEANGAAWLNGLAPGECRFERGFVTVSVEGKKVHRLTTLESKPGWRWVEGVEVRGCLHTTAAWLAHWPGLGRLCGLSLGRQDVVLQEQNPLRAEGARILADSPYLAGLSRLCLAGCLLGDEGAAALTESSYLGKLVRLDLPANMIRATGASDLANSPMLARLRHLGLANNVLQADGVAALANSACLVNLQSLDLGRNILGPGGARELVAGRGLERLTALDLRLNGIMNSGARALAGSPLGKRLRRLNLVGNGIVDQDVRTLCQQLDASVEM
jgi:uncharacterized protein (TIGR02996 family)